MNDSQSVHIDLDGAWPRDSIAPADAYFDCRAWGAQLRYSTTRSVVRDFFEHVKNRLTRFTLFGSGDYHHLTAIWLRRLDEPFALLSFDNHPDWDIRPPHWCCGTWINRALELPHLQNVAIWGCGNFELNWPHRLFANRLALREKRVRVWPWTARLNPEAQKYWQGIARENWREQFQEFAKNHAGKKFYVTVDFDCLNAEESATNWENGLFTAADVAWALAELREHAEILGGDLCGAYSVPRYARFKQRIESTIDHPRLPPLDAKEAAARNQRSLTTIWPELTRI